MSYLIVVAHPDDEVLGAGATIVKLTTEGQKVAVCILSGDAGARNNRPELSELYTDTENCLNLLGVDDVTIGNFPNIEFNTVPHLHMVQFIENVILRVKPHTVMTHHPSDLNNDHIQTSQACQAASRIFQRRSDIPPIRQLLFMEVLSSTEWNVDPNVSFRPNLFVEVQKEGISKKIEALSRYSGVMRSFPHPRSEESIFGLAAYRGVQSGMQYAEAFECVFRRGLQ